MVKIGFIVEGASEKKLLETSQNFRDFFSKCGFELVKVQDAKGGGICCLNIWIHIWRNLPI